MAILCITSAKLLVQAEAWQRCAPASDAVLIGQIAELNNEQGESKASCLRASGSLERKLFSLNITPVVVVATRQG